MDTATLIILFGAAVGFSLGLTGGGGAIFAVPLLIYGVHINLRTAVGISLASVCAMSAVGLLGRIRSGGVEWRTGLIFALAGSVGAPVGTWISPRVPEPFLLFSFALLMAVVSVRMWWTAHASQPSLSGSGVGAESQPTCRRDNSGTLKLTSRCAMLLILAGVLTGVLSGLFGVGGGFIIVPALVLITRSSMHRAVATSLLVITLISLSGLASHVLSGLPIEVQVTVLFALGGIGGMFLGIYASRRFSGPALQKFFAGAILAVATFVVYRSIYLP